jgi:hypothetical protein
MCVGVLLRFEQGVEVESVSVHLGSAVGGAGPLVLRSVPAKFQPIIVRVAEIEGLAHAMVARPIERNAGRHQSA